MPSSAATCGTATTSTRCSPGCAPTRPRKRTNGWTRSGASRCVEPARHPDTPMSIPATFDAFRIHNDASGYRSEIERISLDDLNPGEVLIKTVYSSINFKDALAGTGQGKILRWFPLVGGIDVAGHVVASTDESFREGDPVLVTGSGL